jgi:hypothetical protein
LAVAILATLRAGLGLPLQGGSFGFTGRLIGLFYALAFVAVATLLLPLANSVYVFALSRWVSNANPSFGSLFTGFVLCELPIYLRSVLGGLSDVFYSGVGNMAGPVAGAHPFLYDMLATITPFFGWKIILWWIAVTVLLRLKLYQRLLLVGSLALLDTTFAAVLGSFAKF